MNPRIVFIISLISFLLLITACTGFVDSVSTYTPDPLLMDTYTRTVWDIENFQYEVSELAAEASGTPVEELEPIIHEMIALREEIESYEFTLSAAQAHSALYNYAFYTEQCYFSKYADFLIDSSIQESMRNSEDNPCEQVIVYMDTLSQYLHELKESDTDS